ncbi:hypothetical protein GALMADRAFT_245174 [Galerina marginata CBS 339.88]|uniref:AAA+ ATPase domain-containing protein n=1 Tax=Galerina marginata (strain CBS 339.88) TaxID=685588 RepID=A0A067T710_GALM3|nr:hypothetical protein GALMADRAFT_245174 [Galerina marginata CBS 339.88]
MDYGFGGWPTSYNAPQSASEGSWLSDTSFLTRIVGFSFFASLLQSNSLALNSFKLFILGTLAETGRRLCQWVYERFSLFQYSITAQFDEGDPVYEWIILFLTEHKVWKRSRQFHVTATSSKRKWGIKPSGVQEKILGSDNHADYVPTYEAPQLFQWRGYWVEIKRSPGQAVFTELGSQAHMNLYLTVYTRDMSALSSLVEEARQLYVKKRRPHVIVHTVDQNHFDPSYPWMNTKSKSRRPLDSIILQEGVLQSLVEDAKEFLSTEDWYTTAGIPHRRGYLLHGPPGTGKTSTIYAIAGELGLEIYSLSLSSSFVDDSFLQRAVASIPKGAIFLIEDIDCAFPSRDDLEDLEDSPPPFYPGMYMSGPRGGRRGSAVTLSGLLNVLDGVGSEEGKIFFATTNYIDRLDPALLRPGRIDRKVQYYPATKGQAEALFTRFYPTSYTNILPEMSSSPTQATAPKVEAEKIARAPSTLSLSEKEVAIKALAAQFASQVPQHEFSTAELQGYLLSCKKEPERAVADISGWVKQEREEREAKRIREEERLSRLKEKRDSKEAEKLQGSLTRLSERGMLGPLNSVGAAAPGLSVIGNQVSTQGVAPTLTAPTMVVDESSNSELSVHEVPNAFISSVKDLATHTDGYLEPPETNEANTGC